MALLRLAVLGPPEVVHDGRRLTFALRKAEALLLYLAVEGGMHSRSKLAALLWPDSAPPTARTGLRNALLLLRTLLDNPEAQSISKTRSLICRDPIDRVPGVGNAALPFKYRFFGGKRRQEQVHLL